MQTAAGRFAPLKALGILGACVWLSSCGVAAKKTNPATAPADSSAVSAQHGSGYSASLLSAVTVDGSMMVVNVTFERPFKREVSAEFEKKKFALYSVDDTGVRYQGLFGIPHSHHPGSSTLTVRPEGLEPLVLKFEINDAHYPSETLKVNPSKVNPPKKVLPRIFREQAEVKEIYALETGTRLWNGAFAHPTDTVITDQFGMKRLYNGELRSYHGGMDFRAKIGTPIHAAAAGRVVLAKNLFYSGGTVIIDHGYGLLTMYFHQSKILAKKGQMVSEGQLIGYSGKSGRVTGPHLHFQVVVHGTKVNPKDLFEELK